MNLNDHVCICNRCILNSKKSSFNVYGSKTAYTINNQAEKRVSKFIIDDCVLAMLNNEVKCDYLFIIDNLEKKDGYFVELKGADVPKAIIQLINSIKNLKDNITGTMFGRIVCSKFPRAPDTFRSNNYIKLRKLVRGNIEIKSSQLSDTI